MLGQVYYLTLCLKYPLSNSYNTVCLPVCGDDPQALASRLSPIQAEESRNNYFIYGWMDDG